MAKLTLKELEISKGSFYVKEFFPVGHLQPSGLLVTSDTRLTVEGLVISWPGTSNEKTRGILVTVFSGNVKERAFLDEPEVVALVRSIPHFVGALAQTATQPEHTAEVHFVTESGFRVALGRELNGKTALYFTAGERPGVVPVTMVGKPEDLEKFRALVRRAAMTIGVKNATDSAGA